MKENSLERLVSSRYGKVYKTRPYFNHSVEFKKQFTALERMEKLQNAGFNVFNFPAEMVTGCDLLSDSGTTTLSNEQWAAIHLGDEAYASNKGYFLFIDQCEKTFGEGFSVFLFHQGRAAENALFNQFKGKQTWVIPSNGHFDTTRANIEANKLQALDLFSDSLKVPSSEDCFKGNINIGKLKKLFKQSAKNVPLVFLTITNNTGGGQPVSMENIKDAARLSKAFNTPLFFDACRFAENAYFIKNYEQGYKNKSVGGIVREMFSAVDGFTISFKKDGLSNMGGGLFIRKEGLFTKKFPQITDQLLDYQILTEGHPTYGGMSGRDIAALSIGLGKVTDEDYLSHRVKQVQDFGKTMKNFGLPALTPAGGHAVYLDMDKFFKDTDFQPENFGGISFTAFLLVTFGHRVCELGNFAFGKFDRNTQTEILPEVNYVRFAVPRLRYEKQDLDAVAQASRALYQDRVYLPKMRVVYGRDLPLRHFKARFEIN
ncbi:tryptophanase [Candidatus Daviesbacteria bacterium]|nr:tryptophanase [Candidatus Daviesbacteria bacterium]